MSRPPTTGQHVEWPADWVGDAVVPIGVDEAFNGYLAAHIIFSLDRLGLLDELLRNAAVDERELAACADLDPGLLHELLAAAGKCGYVSLVDGVATLTAAGSEMARMRGYFTWAVGGYGTVFAGIADLVSGEAKFNQDVLRNEAMVALGSSQNDRTLMSGILDDALADLDFAMIADLGSGISSRVSRVVSGRDGARGIGLDISAAATRLAETTIRQAGLSGRVEARRADVLDLICGKERYPDLAEVDAVMSFFLLHDLLASPDLRPRVMPGLREAFPMTRTFILADTMIMPASADAATLPVFSVGYQLAHALMGVPLHSREGYETLFADAGLRVKKILSFGTPHSWLYVLEPG